MLALSSLSIYTLLYTSIYTLYIRVYIYIYMRSATGGPGGPWTPQFLEKINKILKFTIDF